MWATLLNIHAYKVHIPKYPNFSKLQYQNFNIGHYICKTQIKSILCLERRRGDKLDKVPFTKHDPMENPFLTQWQKRTIHGACVQNDEEDIKSTMGPYKC
jgi:hypothetical protein